MTYNFSGGEIRAIHVTTIVIRVISPPPIKSKMNDERMALVVHVRWSETMLDKHDSFYANGKRRDYITHS